MINIGLTVALYFYLTVFFLILGVCTLYIINTGNGKNAIKYAIISLLWPFWFLFIATVIHKGFTLQEVSDLLESARRRLEIYKHLPKWQARKAGYQLLWAIFMHIMKGKKSEQD